MKMYLGCSGWYYDHWINRFYPIEIKKSEWLPYYAQNFQTVEINSTFYRFPREKMLQNWYEKTPEDFKFILKVNQSITHRKKFKDTSNLLRNFYELSEYLREKLGGLLFQLPPNIHKNMKILKRALEQFDTSNNNVLEFRHPSWYDEDVYKLLDDYNVIFCSVSTSNLPQDLIVIKNKAYIRFHGTDEDKRYQHLYSDEELRQWARKIKREDISELYCYFNNDYHANAVKNCLKLKKLLED